MQKTIPRGSSQFSARVYKTNFPQLIFQSNFKPRNSRIKFRHFTSYLTHYVYFFFFYHITDSGSTERRDRAAISPTRLSGISSKQYAAGVTRYGTSRLNE